MSNAARSQADDIASGPAALGGAQPALDNAVKRVTEEGREARRAARDVRDTFDEANRTSVRRHPYTALAIAGLLGFAYAVMRR